MNALHRNCFQNGVINVIYTEQVFLSAFEAVIVCKHVTGIVINKGQ